MNITYAANGDTPEINVNYNNALIITISGVEHICHLVYKDEVRETWEILISALYAYEAIAEIDIHAGENQEKALVKGCLDARERWS